MPSTMFFRVLCIKSLSKASTEMKQRARQPSCPCATDRRAPGTLRALQDAQTRSCPYHFLLGSDRVLCSSTDHTGRGCPGCPQAGHCPSCPSRKLQHTGQHWEARRSGSLLSLAGNNQWDCCITGLLPSYRWALSRLSQRHKHLPDQGRAAGPWALGHCTASHSWPP